MSGVLDKRDLAKRLVPAYVADDRNRWGVTRVGLARLCDEAIDQTGELLGLIREFAFEDAFKPGHHD